MDLSNIKHQFLRLAGETAVAHPEAWIYSWVLVGTALGISMCAGIGWWIGGFFSHPTTGMYCGLAWYAYQFTMNVEPMKAVADDKVANIKALKELMWLIAP